MIQTRSTRTIVFRFVAALGMVAFANVGCALFTPYQEPVPVQPVVMGADEELGVDRVIVLFDASGSIHHSKEFPSEKAWVESFVQGMPDGQYEATILSFGGKKRRGGTLAPFDREQLTETANGLKYIGEGSPLDAVLLELADQLASAEGDTAIIIITDGLPNRPVYGGPAEPTLDASRAVVEKSPGTVCFHTVMAGNDAGGEALLTSIATLTPCGSFTASSGLSDGTRIASFERDIFFTSAALPAVAAAPIDPDRDGIIGAADRCPQTPVGAVVDIRGCWQLGANFASNSAELTGGDAAAIAEVAQVLMANPDLRIQIAGYTDASGSATYNQSLSERRAESVRSALIDAGIDSGRLEVAGYGEENPVADNATAEGRAENRRIELVTLS